MYSSHDAADSAAVWARKFCQLPAIALNDIGGGRGWALIRKNSSAAVSYNTHVLETSAAEMEL